MRLLLISIFLAVALTGCINKKIHQGNVINPNSIWIVQEGDTRFTIESELGTPSVKDASHPERALYIDYFFDEETGEKYTRGVEVTYDDAWRAKNIRRFGYE